MTTSKQDVMREAWLGGRTGCLTAKEEAKAYGAKWDDVERTWYTTGENYAENKDFFDGYAPTASQENTNACPW